MEEENLEAKIKEYEKLLKAKDEELGQLKEQCAKLTIQVKGMFENIQGYIQIVQNLYNQIVPQKLPFMGGFKVSMKFEPGQIFSSAYFDFFKLDKTKMAVFLSSCSNSSLSSQVMKTLLDVLENKSHLEHPKSFLNHLIEPSKRMLKPYEHLNMFYGILDRSNMTLTYSFFGDILALHKTPDEVCFVDSQATSLSEKNTPEIKEERIKIHKQDYLILATEQAMNVQNTSEETFGKQRLKLSLERASSGVHEIKNALLFDLKNFKGEADLTRDLIVIVLKAEPHFLKLIDFPLSRKK